MFVSATHGETAEEVLGSGDASIPYQRFKLKQPPLTHMGVVNSPSGVESSLDVRIDGVRWHEVNQLYGAGPKDRVYSTQTDEGGASTVVFGNGRTGARPPTGQENIHAQYRKGIGRAGLVEADQITLVPVRPRGLRSVTNPLPSTDAQDPEQVAEIRENAPLTVLTLDRLVSLQDYEDFAKAFGGITKALATWFWDGQRRGVFVTVAGADESSVSFSRQGDLGARLVAAMRQHGDPFVPLRVGSYRPAWLRLDAGIKVDPDYWVESVFAAVRAALHTQFEFTARTLGQPVALSEALAVMQDIVGVQAVDVNAFYRSGTGRDVHSPGAEHALARRGPPGRCLSRSGAGSRAVDP